MANVEAVANELAVTIANLSKALSICKVDIAERDAIIADLQRQLAGKEPAESGARVNPHEPAAPPAEAPNGAERTTPAMVADDIAQEGSQ